MLKLSKKAQLVLNKVEIELKSGTFSLADKVQLCVFGYENPSITYLGLLEKAEKYLPTNINLPEKQLDGLLKIYLAYKQLVDKQFSSVALRMYPEICIKIKLKEIVYEKCWYLSYFIKFLKEIDTSKYLEFEGWEEVFLVSAVLGQTRVDITKIDVKIIKDFYLKSKLKVKSISKLHKDLSVAAISSREMKWETMSPDELQREKVEITNSNLFGKISYLRKLQDEFKV